MSEEINNNLPVLYNDQLVEIAEKAERRIGAIVKIKKISLKVTNAHDWTNQQDKPYLQVSGAEKVARLFGISWRIDDPLMVLEDDGHFSFTYKGYFSMGEAEIEAIGTRSSKDGFFKRYSYEGDGNDKKRIELPPSEIDKGDVKKAAFTNCIGNGVTRLLGIRNLTWEDLQEAGIKKEDVSKIDYDKPEMTGEAKTQRNEIERMLNEMSGGDKGKTGAILKKATAFTASDGKEVPGKDSIEKLTAKQIPKTLERLTTAYNEWKKKVAENGTPGTN